MKNKENNYAFIDSQNLNLSIKNLGWKLDFRKFRRYLKEKYGITKAFLFIGYIDGNGDLYKALQDSGFICIFKPTLTYKTGKIKGNCDAELVLQTMIEYPHYEKAVIITGDGDFHCLVKYLIQEKKLKKLLVPDQKSYSALLKRFPSEFLAFVSDLKKKLSYKKRTQ
ncbi:NYN domain-containing protein [Candidatus Peregrinibacteria bacterium]|nr:NYN domain-containing protein [Candidatus Peregrinibacteria bacterium]MBT4632259.1 NYN domain-containing protein [Candidatus Peregrinibacteria bacterium]MBT5516655.1 NYN domain-containing protein [Candidatus Peregrinibacteria bacterium]MBT5824330.1 NYN domain-containing protein [Candidatus Peregrinibacteria bacterium]